MLKCAAILAGGGAILGGIVKVTRLLTLLGFAILLMLSGSALAQTAPTAPILLKGAPMGAVKFDHTAHLKVAGKCDV